MGIEAAIIGSAAIGAGSGAYGASQGKKQAHKQWKTLQKTVEAYEGAQLGNIEQGFGEQERLISQANREELEGAEEGILRFEGAGAQAIEDQTERAIGGGKSALSSRGLLGSSVEGNLRIGAGRAASRSYMSLGEAVSAQRQALAARRAAGTARMGQLKAYKSQAKNQVLGQSLSALVGFQASQTPIVQNPDLSGLGYGLGLLAANKGGGGGINPGYASQQMAQDGLGTYSDWL